MMHELGHNLGFAHQDQIMDTMSTSNGGGDYMYGYDYGQYIPSPDFMKGLNYIYGPLSINDVAISPYLFGVAPTAPPGTSQKSVYFSPESITTCPGNSDPYKFSIHNRFNNYKNLH